MEKLYKIERPDISNISIYEDISIDEEAKIAKDVYNIQIKNHNSCLVPQKQILEFIQKTFAPKYLNWKDIKYKDWIPFKDNKEIFWAVIKFYRKFKISRKASPIRDQNGIFFTWGGLEHYDQLLHEIDLDMSKYLLNFPNISKKDHLEYQKSGIIEEAITSAQLEGAHTTRKVAKEMILQQRKPKNHSEKMIFNNFTTMKTIQETYKDDKLSVDMLLDMHRTITLDTLGKESEEGQFRSPDDKIVIQKGDDPSIISYVTPPIDFVKEEIHRLIDFANDDLKGDFVHPIIKAIMLHFWIGLLHPFVDGNGRMARALFYWYLLRRGYWAFAFLPISAVIKRSATQYSEAYISSEQDDNDLNYFIDYNIRKILQSVDSFKEYIKKKTVENEKFEKISIIYNNLNHRQLKTILETELSYQEPITTTLYRNIHNISKITAIKDLKNLLELGLVSSEKKGRNVFYTPTRKISEIRNKLRHGFHQ